MIFQTRFYSADLHEHDSYLTNVSDEVLFELLVSWESWDGSPKDFFSALGSNGKQMAGIIGRAKRDKRGGRFGNAEFREALVEGQPLEAPPVVGSSGKVIEFVWPDGRLVRFPDLSNLARYARIRFLGIRPQEGALEYR